MSDSWLTHADRPGAGRRTVIGLVVVLAMVAASTVVLRAVADRVRTLPAPASARLPGLLRTTAPWPPNTADLGARLRLLGLPPTGAFEHVHVFVTVVVHGRRVPVPADVGLSADAEAPLHVHAGEPGMVHVESLLPFWRATLGEFFDVWGVRLSSSCVGAYCSGSDDRLEVFVGGRPFDGDPRLVALTDHEDITVVFGTAGERPAELPSFDWSTLG